MGRNIEVKRLTFLDTILCERKKVISKTSKAEKKIREAK